MAYLSDAGNALYTAIDFITQAILVSVFFFTHYDSCFYSRFSFPNKDIPMLDDVAPTIGHRFLDLFKPCVFRY